MGTTESHIIEKTTHCKNCNTTLRGDFCHICGQKLMGNRLTTKGILKKFFATLINLEKGFLHTSKMLFLDPGKVVKDAWNRITVPYTPSFRYVLIWATLAVLVNVYLGIFDSQQAEMGDFLNNNPNEKSAAMQQKIMEIAKNYMSFVMILIIPFLSLASRLLFKEERLNFAEHLVMNTYFMGQQAMIGIPMMLLAYLLPFMIKYYVLVGILISGLYLAYGYKSIFKISNGQALLKGIATYIIGYLLYMLSIVVLMIIGLIIYLVFVKLILS